jgi:hypothetical protein
MDQNAPAHSDTRRRPAAPIRLTDRDRIALEFAAEHRLVLAAQVAVLLQTSVGGARKRLGLLVGSGWLRFERKFTGPGCYLIERRGLAAVGSRLPRPRDLDPAAYDHDVGLGWLWLAARRGWFGTVDRVVSEREMRSHDGRPEHRREPIGVRLGGVGPRGGERRHYPDLLLECRTGHRVAVELELTTKPRRRLEGILAGYATDPRIDAVLYLVRDPPTGRAIERAAASLGSSPTVIVQRTRVPAVASRTSARVAQRRARHAGQRLEVER